MLDLFSMSDDKHPAFTNSVFVLIVFGMTFNVYPPGKYKVHYHLSLEHVKTFISNLSVVLKVLSGYEEFPKFWNPCDTILATQSQDEHFENMAWMLLGQNNYIGSTFKHLLVYHKQKKLSEIQTVLLQNLYIIE